MKRKLLALLIIPVILCGCNGSVGDNVESHAQITVNYPNDDTVNGYRPGGSGSMPDEIPADRTVPAKPKPNETAPTAYIGNSNSKKFHTPDCLYAKKLKDENRVSFKSREEAVSEGYAPCGKCKP